MFENSLFLLSVFSFSYVYCDLKIPSINEEPSCKYEGVSFNLASAGLSTIAEDFLSSPLIHCLTLADNEIWNIERTAFRKVPNLYYLNLAGNTLVPSDFDYDFSTIKTLVLDNAFVIIEKSQVENYFRCNRNDKSSYRYRDSNPLSLSIAASLSNLEKLYLRNNNLKTLSWMRGPPNITHLHLEKNRINPENFPLYIPSSLTHLYLSENSIDRFVRTSILKQLEELSLDNNNIEYLCADYGCGLQKRQRGSGLSWEFDVNNHNNQHDILRYMDLGGATNLKKLSISGNSLWEIREGAFNDLHNLEFLDLSRNPLQLLPHGVFDTLPSLKTLLLNSNNLHWIPNINNLQNLEILMLNRNEITTINPSSLSNLDKLKTLNLANNKLNQIDFGSFDTLPLLQSLDLSSNQLMTLPQNWISPEATLRCLHLDNNAFTNIEDMSLSNLTDIEFVNIVGNPFAMLSVKSLRNLPENTIINVIRNGPIEIDTEIPSSCR